MKYFKILMVSIFLLMSSIVFAQNATKNVANRNKGIFKFKTEKIEYGIIEQNSNGHREFVFKNVGTEPIIITNVKGSCGCTVVTKPKKPIMPGENGTINVSYDTKRLGNFNKSITISSNANEEKKIIQIKGRVIKPSIIK